MSYNSPPPPAREATKKKCTHCGKPAAYERYECIITYRLEDSATVDEQPNEYSEEEYLCEACLEEER
jgi:hypothetical protein